MVKAEPQHLDERNRIRVFWVSQTSWRKVDIACAKRECERQCMVRDCCPVSVTEAGITAA